MSALALSSGAQPGSDTTYSVIVSNRPIYDVSLLYSGRSQDGDQTREVHFFMEHLGSGKITGTGSVAYTTVDYHFAGPGRLRGQYHEDPFHDKYGFILNTHVSGENAAGHSIGGNYQFRARVVEDAAGRFLGAATDVACVRRYGSETNVEPLFFEPRALPGC